MKTEELKSKLNEQEDLAPLTDKQVEPVSGGTNPFADAPRVKEKEIDDRVRDAVTNP